MVKKQQRSIPLVCGLSLMIFPYFVENTLWMTVIGIVLSVLPYFIRL
ncbi:hypothetical protein QE384_000989 [Acinetobacter baylyi]|nr:hypothetical protein [Acinetobacter baylyi]